MTSGPRPAAPPTRFDAIAETVGKGRRWYDRKDSKHIRFTEDAGIHLHRSLRWNSDESSAKSPAEVAGRRSSAARDIYAAVAEGFGDDAAKAIFLKVKGDSFDPRSGLASGASLTLREFDRIAAEVAIVRGNSGAIVNGVAQESEFPEDFNDVLSARLNAQFAEQAPAGLPPQAQQPFAPLALNPDAPMMHEMGSATYSVDGVVISSPDREVTGFPAVQDDDWNDEVAQQVSARLYNQTQVRAEDLTVLGDLLHRGLFRTFQDLAGDRATQAGPGLQFATAYDPRQLQVRCWSDGYDSGRYTFEATLTQPLEEVAAAEDPGQRDRLDPARSFLRLQIAGTIYCDDPDSPLEITGSALQYAAVPRDGPPSADV